jgi:hypothetical protein
MLSKQCVSRWIQVGKITLCNLFDLVHAWHELDRHKVDVGRRRRAVRRAHRVLAGDDLRLNTAVSRVLVLRPTRQYLLHGTRWIFAQHGVDNLYGYDVLRPEGGRYS